MNIFDKFNSQFGGEALAKEVQEMASKTTNAPREEVPTGVYEVAIEKLELTTSKSEKPMLSCWFKIVAGNHKGQYIFMNQLVDAAFKIHIANEFLKSLDTATDVKFDGDFNRYANMIASVFHDSAVNKLEYQLRYSENSKGFKEYKIEQVFEGQ
jgi:hypothetical protein